MSNQRNNRFGKRFAKTTGGFRSQTTSDSANRFNVVSSDDPQEGSSGVQQQRGGARPRFQQKSKQQPHQSPTAPTDRKSSFKNVKKATPDLTPKHLSNEHTTEKNDPMLSEHAVTDGVSGFLELGRNRRFQCDFSGFIALCEAAYAAQTTTDRSVTKYISRAMWNYYHIILLWRKLLTVKARFGEDLSSRDQFHMLVNADLPCSQELAAYINGVGDIIDQDGARARFVIQSRIVNLQINGARGSFGRITSGTHIMYETMPSPMIALLRILADIEYTANRDGFQVEWNLPEQLRPSAHYGATLPTVQLLGWRPAEYLTPNQSVVLRNADITREDFGVVNVADIPVNELLLHSIAGYISSSRAPCFKVPNDTVFGSLCQVPFSARTLGYEDYEAESERTEEVTETVATPVTPTASASASTSTAAAEGAAAASGSSTDRPASGGPAVEPDPVEPIDVQPLNLLGRKRMITSSCKQFSTHIASIAATFRYRIQRHVVAEDGYENVDMLCYRFRRRLPTVWVNNSNNVFNYGLGVHWNVVSFTMPEVSGASMMSKYSEEIRRNVLRR